MKIFKFILIFSVFLSSWQGNTQTLGPGEDPFYACKPKPTGDTERQETKVKFLEESQKINQDRIRLKEEELTKLKVDLDIANKKVQNTSDTNRDSSVMDERQTLINKISVIQKEIENLRKVETMYSENLKYAMSTLNAQKERDKLTNSSIEIFTLTTGELSKSSPAGSIADTNLQLMALATSGATHLNCRPASDTDSASYYIFQAASAAYLTNNLSEIMDYENLAECVTKKALSPTEKKDVQYALIKRARDLFKEMERHVTSVINTRGTDLELFYKALEYSMKEWAAKNARVATSFATYTAAVQNEKDAYNWWLGVMIAAITMSALTWVPFFGAYAALVAIALWAFWGASLVPKLNQARITLKDAKRELNRAHQHSSLTCNYSEAKRWDLPKEMEQFERYLHAKKLAREAALAEEEARKQQYKEQQYQEERSKSEAKSSFLIIEPRYFHKEARWIDFLFPNLFAQDQDVLNTTITKIQDAYMKSTSTDPLTGSMVTQGDPKSRIPSFTPGTPQGAAVVEDLRRKFEAKKQVYLVKKTEVDKLYQNLENLMKDYNDYSTKFGDVATKNPEIKCSNEWPFPYYRAVARGNGINWDNTEEGKRWASTWKTKGCTTDNKNTLDQKQKALSQYWDTITPQDAILSVLELAMDQAELDYLTAMQINSGADGSDPYGDKLSPESREAASFADFLGKIKAEWKTSSMDTEKNNFILVDRTSDWTLEKLLNEHQEIKNLPANKKAGFADAYTRYIYMQYAVDLVLKNLEMLARAKSMAVGQALAYQELLSQADLKLGLDAVALPETSLKIAKSTSCMASNEKGFSADPSCSCKAKGTCSRFSFPTAIVHTGKDLSSGIIEGYINETFSGGDGARIRGDGVKRNAATTKTSIENIKLTLLDQRKTMGFQNKSIENSSNLLMSTIQADARRSAAAAISNKSSAGRGARILALEKKVLPENVQKALAAATVPSKTVPKIFAKNKSPLEMGELSIEEGGTATEAVVEDLDLNLPVKREQSSTAPVTKDSKSPEVEYDPSKTLWKIISTRYKNSAFPKLLKLKKKD